MSVRKPRFCGFFCVTEIVRKTGAGWLNEGGLMTKIDIISGFLGAGKTTFIKKLLEEALKDEKVVLIENEFGEIGIDGGFLKDAGIEIREMSQGCICCSLVGDFETALKEVIAKYEPQRVIIEPSGVGKLSDVMKAVKDASANLPVQLNSAVTVVDANKCKMYMKNFGEFFNNQVQYAGTIVLSRADVAPDEKIEGDVELLRSLNDKAEIITTPVTELSGKKLLSIMEKHDNMTEELLREAQAAAEAHAHEHHHHHDHEHEEHECGCEHHHHDHEHEEHECGYEHHHDHEHEEHECGCEHHHEHEEHECGCGHHHHHDADEVFSSWGRENVPPITKEKLRTILEALSDGHDYGQILRAKGMLKAADGDGWYYFDLVPGETEIRGGEPEYTGKVCVIGSSLNEEKLAEAFLA